MRVLHRATVGAAACAVALAAGAISATATTPAAKVRGFSCQHSVNPVGRGIAVSAVMRPVKGTRRMALRFELLARSKSAPTWTSVAGGDLGSWLTPRNPTLGQRAADVWIVNKSVNELAAPAAYRYRVTFRWTGSHGRTLATAVRTSPTCNQPELRPDLLVQSIDVRPVSGHPNQNLYVATIANHGATSAKGFRVQFYTPAGGGTSKYRSIRLLRAHAQTTVAFVGPACSTSAASTITADPDDVVDDADRTNNTVTAACSSASGHA